MKAGSKLSIKKGSESGSSQNTSRNHNVRHPRCDYNKLDWSVYICLTQLYDGIDMYIIYYIKNNYMFRPFSLAIFRLINEKKLSKQLYSTCVVCIQWEGEVGTRSMTIHSILCIVLDQ